MSDGPVRKLHIEERRWEWLIYDGPHDLKPQARLILQLLFRYHIRYPEIFVSEATIAKQTGMTERSVRTHLKTLEADEWFRREEKGRAYSYRLLFPSWFNKGDDEFLLEVRKRKLISRLEWRIDNAEDYGDGRGSAENWQDFQELICELQSLGVDVTEHGVAPEYAEFEAPV